MYIKTPNKSKLKKRIYSWNVMLVKYAKKKSTKNAQPVKTMWSQIIKSGTKAGANYMEAVTSPSEFVFKKSLSNSLISCNESKYWLQLIRDTGLDQSYQLDLLLSESRMISRLLGRRVASVTKEK